MVLHITVASVSRPALYQSDLFSKTLSGKGADFHLHYVGGGAPESEIYNDISTADIVIADLMGVRRDVYSGIASAVKACKGIRICIGGMALQLNRLGGYDERRMKDSPEDAEAIERISQAWKRAEYHDIEFIYTMLLSRYLGVGGLPEAQFIPCRTGVYVKDPLSLREFDDVGSYSTRISEEGYDVALLSNGSNYPHQSTAVVRALFEKLSESMRVLPIAMNSYSISNTDQLRSLIGSPKVIVNLLPFRFMAGPMGGDSVSANWLLRELDAPLISPFCFSKRSMEEWSADPVGIDPMEFMLDIFLPELDGAFCTIPAGFQKVHEEPLGTISLMETVPLEERIERICGKAERLVALSNKQNSDKKVAIIAYNYPPGEDNLFGGSYLDGSGSLSRILEILKDAGYDTEPMEASEIIDAFIGNGLLNDGKWHDGFKAIHYDPKKQYDRRISDYWGDPPGKVMADSNGYIIPGLRLGNVFIGIQPPRVSDSVDASTYHDQSIPPHHQYAAFYDWIENEFKADAIIHLGTHGTLEFLPGKEMASSEDCFPDKMLGNVPHFYLYYSGNTSEAMIAKRRTHAVLISYMQPPMIRSGLYGELSELEGLIAEYRESQLTDPGRAELISERIIEKAESMRLPAEMESLEDELLSMKESLIPEGLHVFGQPSTIEQAEGYVAIIREAGTELSDDDLIARYRSDLEMRNLIHALDGGYIEPAVGGDAMMDPDVLPSGRNLVQFNPIKVPTRSAFERGYQAAEDTIRSFIEQEGRVPESAGLILWGLETSRTQGMSIGQICGYLGLRMVRDDGDFCGRFEPIPLEELRRPRVDVVVTICGFFRDMFPQLIGGLDGLFRMVSDLDEGGDNPICSHSMDNLSFLRGAGLSEGMCDSLSKCRLFGPADGQYGTGMTGLVNSSQWEEEDELCDSFVSSMHYAYTSSERAEDVPGLLEFNHRRVEVISQIRDSTDREIIDLDHYYEFLGGLSKSVQMASNRMAVAFVVDGSRPRVRITSLQRSIEHGVRTRLLNPKWIEGLLAVNYHGVQSINDRLENVLGLAATTGQVQSGVFSDMMQTYVSDEDMRRRMMENNNWAYLSMLERFSEAERRGYWDATDEELEKLKDAFCEAEERLEMDTDDR
jgi:cobaltochelatase CobN